MTRTGRAADRDLSHMFPDGMFADVRRSITTPAKGDATGGKSDAAGGKSDATGDKSDATGGKSDAAGDKSDAAGGKSDAAGDKSDAAGGKSDVAGGKSEAAGGGILERRARRLRFKNRQFRKGKRPKRRIESAMRRIAGVDGCPGGWLAVSENRESGDFSAKVYASAAELLAERWDCVAIDIPIGLTDAERRRADEEARLILKPHQTSSVFQSPVRPALAAKTRIEASEITRSLDGRGVGAQAFGIFAKVKQVDDALLADAALRSKVFEIHPEVSFAAMNGGRPLAEKKREPSGRERRKGLIAGAFPPTLFDQVRSQFARRLCADDDILDAIAALWSCRRICNGTAASLPHPPETDAQGICSAIWY